MADSEIIISCGVFMKLHLRLLTVPKMISSFA